MMIFEIDIYKDFDILNLDQKIALVQSDKACPGRPYPEETQDTGKPVVRQGHKAIGNLTRS